MVLQRNMELPIWGTADAGDEVFVQLQVKTKDGSKEEGKSVKVGSNGKWMLKLGKFDHGSDGKLTVKDAKKTITLKNILIGEVWVCSGQSNMEWSITSSAEPEAVIKGSNQPMVRLFTVTKTAVPEPQSGFGKPQPNRQWENKWLECTPETSPPFSAVAYHFGVSMSKARNVPIGLLHTSWGGTPAEAWTSKEALLAEPMLKYYVENLETAKKNFKPEVAKQQYEEALEKWKIAAEKAKEEKKNPPPAPRLAQAPGFGSGNPSSLYNGMIAPLLPFAIEGAIWYQGESNAGRAYEYRTLFPTMIQDWRNRWGYEFPFFCVQLAPFWSGKSDGVNYAELRDSQLYTTTKLKKVGIAIITDVGDEKDIHPKQKQPVGERLALAARAIAHGEKIEYSGPLFKSMKLGEGKAFLSFDHVGGGLVMKGDKLLGFQIAGDDNKFVPAEANINGDEVIVSSPSVANPKNVRYGWKNYEVLNFFNKAGLPASPFRTDDLPYTTMPMKK
jgi:sialate O-acetylesterase